MPTTAMWRVRTQWTGIPGLPGVQTLYFDANTGTAASVVSELEQSYTAMDTLFSASVVGRVDQVVETIDPVTGNITAQTNVTTSAITGAGTDDLLSLGTQGLANLLTGQWPTGRQVRGRFYLPGVTEAHNFQGQPNSVYQGALLANITALIGQANVNLVVYSPTHGQWYPITTTDPSAYWARVRSRQR